MKPEDKQINIFGGIVGFFAIFSVVIAVITVVITMMNTTDGNKLIKTLEDHGYKTYYQVYIDGLTYDKDGNCYGDNYEQKECEREIATAGTELLYSVNFYNAESGVTFIASSGTIYTYKAIGGKNVYYNINFDGDTLFSYGTFNAGNDGNDVCGVDLGNGLPEGLFDSCADENKELVRSFVDEAKERIESTGLSEKELTGLYTWILDNMIKPKENELDNIVYPSEKTEAEIKKAGFEVNKTADKVVMNKNNEKQLEFIPDDSNKITMIKYTNDRFKGFVVEYTVSKNYVTGKAANGSCVYTYEDKTETTCTSDEQQSLEDLVRLFGETWGKEIKITIKDAIKYVEELK